MPSQLDLDQGGTFRQWTRAYLGPSVGWINAPLQNILPITASGTYTLDPSTSLVTVNATMVTIILPTVIDPPVGPQALPGLFANNPITIVDIGGSASGSPITIQPHAGETIMGLASISINSNFGGYTLWPSSAQLKWVQAT